MLIVLGKILFVLVLPASFVVAGLLLTAWRQRARERRLVNQVRVTDAIDAELGSIVAPVVGRRLGGGWRVEVAVPFEDPAVVGRVATLARMAMLQAEPRLSRLELLLSAQAPSGRHRTVARPASRIREREVIAWTGTTTSRVSS
jgi:hypothetical protein